MAGSSSNYGCTKIPISASFVLKSFGLTLGKVIGEGTYSKVCVAVVQKENGKAKKLACKIINKKHAGKDFITRFLPRELRIVQKLKHPHIVQVLDILEVKDCIFMLMDYCRNGDLLEFIRVNGPLSENNAKQHFKQLSHAIGYLHDLDIAHRDLKCENVLLTSDCSIKLSDFGFSRFCRDEDTGARILSDTFCGSAAYAAPEILQGISYNPKMYDIWSMGCILYIMLAATMPFDDTNIPKMIKHQLNRSISFSVYNNLGIRDSLKKLLMHLLEPDVTKRAHIKQVLRSKWVTDHKCKKYC